MTTPGAITPSDPIHPQTSDTIPPVPPPPTAGPAPSPGSTPSRPKAWVGWLAGAFALGLLLGVGGTTLVMGLASSGGSDTPVAAEPGPAASTPATATTTTLLTAMQGCGLVSGLYLALGDNNTSLTIDGQPADGGAGAKTEDIVCILNGLTIPSAAMSHISQTTSMDGRQTETWTTPDGSTVEFSWSYHPDRGLDGVIVTR